MAIIATMAEGLDGHGGIVAWDHAEWCAVGQYKNPKLAYVLFDLAPDEQPVRVESFEPKSAELINNILCESVYKEAFVICEKVEVV